MAMRTGKSTRDSSHLSLNYLADGRHLACTRNRLRPTGPSVQKRSECLHMHALGRRQPQIAMVHSVKANYSCWQLVRDRDLFVRLVEDY